MKSRGKNPILLLSLGVMALFLIGFLLLVTFGAQSYRNVVDRQYGNMDARGLTAYLAASMKANDSRGAVSLEDSEHGQVLVVTDGETGYALRYYRYDGMLVEDFARAGTPLMPDEAQGIAATEVFSAEIGPDGLVYVTTDAGRTILHLRTEGEAMP